MSSETAPGWGAVLLGVAIGSAVGYGAARRGLWGARDEAREDLRAAWQDGYGHGQRDESESAFWAGHSRGYSEGARDARELAEGGRDEGGAWGAAYMAGHADGVRSAFEVSDRDHASATRDAYQRGEDAGFTRGFDRAATEAESRGLLGNRRGRATRPGHG